MVGFGIVIFEPVVVDTVNVPLDRRKAHVANEEEERFTYEPIGIFIKTFWEMAYAGTVNCETNVAIFVVEMILFEVIVGVMVGFITDETFNDAVERLPEILSPPLISNVAELVDFPIDTFPAV